jgi:TldD protein
MLDTLEKYLDAAADFVEIRGSITEATSVSIRNDDVEKVVSGKLSLFSIRLLSRGAWGFSTTNNIERLPDVLRSAEKLARVSQKRSLNSGLSDEKVNVDNVTIKPKKDPQNMSLEKKTKDMLGMSKAMRIKGIENREVDYAESCMGWYYLNSEGARISFETPASLLRFTSYTKKPEPQRATDSFGGLFGYELVEKNKGKAERVSRNALRLRKAHRIDSGVYEVVVDQRMAGTLAHEALGHACEADAVLTGESLLRGKLGKRIASRHVTIRDDPTIPQAFGSYPYDDEGVKASKTTLLDKGILQSYLHSRETAQKMEIHSTANARAQSVGYSPIVRMSNTYFEKGDFSQDEIFDIRQGIYAEGISGGAVDISTGNFQFAAESGWLIENGEKTEPLRDISIFGDILGTLANVDAVSKNFKGYFPGMCGKGLQMARVADGGGCVRIRGVRIGGK